MATYRGKTDCRTYEIIPMLMGNSSCNPGKPVLTAEKQRSRKNPSEIVTPGSPKRALKGVNVGETSVSACFVGLCG